MVPGRSSRRALIHAAGVGVLAALLPESVAEARALTGPEQERLAQGDVVKLPLDYELAGRDFFGGIAYVVIPATPVEVMTALNDPASYASILPATQECRVVGKQGYDTRLFLRQGGPLGTAAYVMVVRRESQGLLRFWVDQAQPHDISDGWGYFRVQPWGRGAALLTYAALVHLDFGVVKMVFSELIRKYALTTPALVKAFVQRGRQGG